MFLSALEGRGLGNIRIHPGDVRQVLDILPPASIGRAFLNYPDPWPKTRHRERRFVSADNLDALARVLRAGADLRLATDIPGYARHSLRQLEGRTDFTVAADEATPWPDWPGTRYEAKARAEGRAPRYLTIRRTSAPAP